jgi:hypothetical protein
MERIMRGPFVVLPSPIKVQLTPKYRVCRNLSKEVKAHPSINSFIDKEDFPTKFDTAANVADLVSIDPFFYLQCDIISGCRFIIRSETRE